MAVEIIGHSDILSAFDRFIAADRLGHAYLLVGPAGVGKATVARWVARRLLCSGHQLEVLPSPSRSPSQREGEKEGVGACGVCNAIECGTHPDVHVLRADEGTISIDAVREWTAALSRTSLFAGWKVGIVEGAEALTDAAANACLKAIEEPTPRTVILLTVPSRRQVLPTIASRCALVSCHRVPQGDLEAALRERGVSANDARAVATVADGCPGIALTQLQDPERRQEREELQNAAQALLSGSLADRLRRIDALLRERGNDRAAAAQTALQVVEALRQRSRQQARSANGATPDRARWMDLLARAPEYLTANVSPRLLIETIVVTTPTAEALIPKS